MELSIIIVSWNVKDLLERCLRSIADQSHEIAYEVIVVDNASADRSTAMVHEKFPQVNLIANTENRGFAAACNQGVQGSSGEYVFFLNPDSTITESFLRDVYTYVYTSPDVGVFAPRMLNADGTTQRSIRRFPTPLSQLVILFKLGRIFPRLLAHYRADDFDYKRDRQEIEQPAGAALLVRRDAFDQVGGFDERFFLWFDEVDLCKRIAEKGWRILYCAHATIIHHSGKSFAQKGTLEKQRIFFTSCARYLTKHGGVSGTLAAAVIWCAVGMFALLDAKRLVFFARKAGSILIFHDEKSELTPFFRNDKRIFFLSLGIIIGIELLSLAAYFYGPVGAVTLGLITATTFLITFWRPHYGVAILFAELIIGSKGYLFFLTAGDATLSARMMLFAAVLGGWLLGKLKKRGSGTNSFRKLSLTPFSRFFSSSLRWWYALLGIAVIGGIASGLMRGNDPGLFFADVNAWLFFLILPVVYDALQNRRQIVQFLTIASAALAAHIIKVLVVFYMMGHRGFGEDTLTVVYRWIRSTGVGELTHLDSLYRIFFQSQITVVVLFFILLSMMAVVAHEPFRVAMRRYAMPIIFFVGSIISLIVSFSRSFWLGTILIAVIFFIGLLVTERRQPRVIARFVGIGAGSVVCALIALFAISAIPVPSREGVFSVDLLSERLDDIESEAAAASRWNLLPIMLSEIQKNPLIGYGFGKTLTYTSKDPRILLQSESGEYTTYAFEWGYLDLWLKLGLIGLLAYVLLLAAIFVRGADTLRRLVERGDDTMAVLLRGLLYGFCALLVIHFFTPYLNHPLGIGIVMIVSVFSEKLRHSERSEESHVGRTGQ